MFTIKNTQVSGVIDSIRYLGLPKRLDLNNWADTKGYKRAKKLADVPSGSGHDCFLKGITITSYIIAPQYFWMQWMRYHFQDIISSQSKMHMITKMDLHEQMNGLVDQRIIKVAKEYVTSYEYGDISMSKLVSNIPMGLELGAGIVTNYLQLKTIYKQRKNHKLEEWHMFCDWIEEELPHPYLITGSDE